MDTEPALTPTTSGGDEPVSVVSVRQLAKRYGRRAALDDIDLDIARGTVLGILGPNGAGKSTLLETIAGLRAPTSGVVSVLGVDPRRERRQTTRRVSVQPQSASVFGYLSVRETVRLYASFHSEYRDVAEVIVDVGLAEQSEVRARDLSGGQLRRLLLAVAIVGMPEIVILDEPSAGLDPEAKRHLLDLIRSLARDGTTVIFSTHDMAEAAQICDRVVIVVAGKVRADGAPADLITGGRSTLTFDVVTEEALTRARSVLSADAVTWSQDARGIHVSYATADPDAALEVLTRDSQIRGRSYRVVSPTLEDLYLSIVRGARETDGRRDADA
ncbi:ABC transporter ATP-binding protein [Microbacterium oleivorans]|uniref:ABC transporter ATP-binding protein n=1 Tax=Microbacterium oleivorans TaxID=273677 RepID=UPI0007671523|nr:ABC transporter ATP-binding protein [Microbacterium oleivorans]